MIYNSPLMKIEMKKNIRSILYGTYEKIRKSQCVLFVPMGSNCDHPRHEPMESFQRSMIHQGSAITKQKISPNNLYRNFIRLKRSSDLVILASLVNAHGEPCLEYGCPGRPQYEPFVPAPPGHTPNCAKPGQTFCESLDHYPRLRNLSDQHLKRSLIEGYVLNLNNQEVKWTLHGCRMSFRKTGEKELSRCSVLLTYTLQCSWDTAWQICDVRPIIMNEDDVVEARYSIIEFLNSVRKQLIKFLVDKCNFDFISALRDESRKDFNDYRYALLA
ncbi:hypothetical protein E2986_03289 [Frieseomelitta varia]|uniref:Uncharacterized protein n=1 Tax=Frieseomelitta varia TaxID=561572 RepID=A0A833WEG8_9HYME|nr:hypothetical protein E2986_03289 [Frieseomelitta varia]